MRESAPDLDLSRLYTRAGDLAALEAEAEETFDSPILRFNGRTFNVPAWARADLYWNLAWRFAPERYAEDPL